MISVLPSSESMKCVILSPSCWLVSAVYVQKDDSGLSGVEEHALILNMVVNAMIFCIALCIIDLSI